MTRPIVIAATAAANLEPAPIAPSWILSGRPEAKNKLLAKSRDGTSRIMLWECTAGHFNWHYEEDETVVVISGEVFITANDGEERRLCQGDMAFFPAGSSCRWRVADRVKKVAILRKDLPLPVGFGVRVWHKILHIIGFRSQSPWSLAVLFNLAATNSLSIEYIF
jgi:uncharacterized cupin superfamily protein